MNSLIQLKGKLNEKKSFGKPGPATIPKNSVVSVENIDNLISNLTDLYQIDKSLFTAIFYIFIQNIQVYVLLHYAS